MIEKKKLKEILMNKKELHATSELLKTVNRKFYEALNYVPN